MSERKQRYLAFVDYLGTRELYRNVSKNAALLEDRRMELEHGIHFRLQRAVAEGKIEIGVFSDTVLIAGTGAEEVMKAAIALFDFVLQKTVNRSNGEDIRLLRGGVSKGVELRTDYLRQAPGISKIPFFDSSLAFAYELEEVRRGSRLFLDANIGADQMGSLAQYIFAWEQMTGHGKPVVDMRELLWPASVYSHRIIELCTLLDDCMALWRKVLAANPIDPNSYRATLYHFDETIKTMVRSFVVFGSDPQIESAVDRLVTHLPRANDLMEEINIRFVWGIWFQIVYVLVRLGLMEKYKPQLSVMFQELRRREYLDKFIAEMDCPDYEIMRRFVPNA